MTVYSFCRKKKGKARRGKRERKRGISFRVKKGKELEDSFEKKESLRSDSTRGKEKQKQAIHPRAPARESPQKTGGEGNAKNLSSRNPICETQVSKTHGERQRQEPPGKNISIASRSISSKNSHKKTELREVQENQDLQERTKKL